jgi:hypothetical protein
MSTWGWAIEYGLVALLVLGVVMLLIGLWAQDRIWRWQDRREAKRERRAGERSRAASGDE